MTLRTEKTKGDKTNALPDIVEVSEMPLDEWLKLIFDPPANKLLIDYQFPTKEHRQQYLNSIDERTEEEICSLLRKFLIPSGTLGIDE